MVDATHTSFAAGDRSYFSFIKKDIHRMAEDAGFTAKRLADLDLIVSEITSNLHKYAVDGELLAGLFREGENYYIELISIDNGPGMLSAQKMMVDGVSTAGTLGMGLGSIKRLSDKFDIYSAKGWGTILLSRIYSKNILPVVSELRARLDVRQIVVALPGQQKSGDGTYHKVSDEYFKLMVADGLGHGDAANHAVNEAVKAFRSCPWHSPAEIINYIHKSIKGTRGMVATIIVFDFKLKKWKVAGVGNITTRMSNIMEIKNLMSHNGIIGLNIPSTINDQEVSLDQYHQVSSCSDGIKARWEWSKFPGINRCDLTIQAAAIYKDFARRTDDMSVVLAKINLR